MKKTLVLSLILLLAASTGAMAGAVFSGSLESELSYASDEAEWAFENTLGLNADGGFWALETEIDVDFLDDNELSLGKYKLTVEDDLFSAWIWGNGAETSDLASNLDFIKADKEAGEAYRVAVEAMDLVVVSLDYRRSGGTHEAVRFFADFDVNDIDLGLAAVRDYQKDADTIVASAGTTIDMFTVSGAAGVTLGDDLGYAFGVDAKADATDEITVGAKFWASNPEFVGDEVGGDSTHVSAYAVFNDGTIWARPSVKFEGTFDELEFTSNEQCLQFGYRFDDSIDLTDGDAWDDDWMEVTALAIRGEVKRNAATTLDEEVDPAEEITETTLFAEIGAALPVLNDFLWAKVVLGLEKKDDEDVAIAADAYGFVLVNDRLNVEPHVGYKNSAGDDDGHSLLTEVGATYLIGGVDGPELKLSLANTAFFGVKNDAGDSVDTEMVQTASLSVKVTF